MQKFPSTRVEQRKSQLVFSSRLIASYRNHAIKSSSPKRNEATIHTSDIEQPYLSSPPQRQILRDTSQNKMRGVVRTQRPSRRLTIADNVKSVNGLLIERPISQQQKQPFQEWAFIEKSQSNQNAFDQSLEDSCEANADERESIAVELDEINAYAQNNKQRWDYFPSKDSEEDDGFEHIENYPSSYFEKNGGCTIEKITRQHKMRNQSQNDRPDQMSHEIFAQPLLRQSIAKDGIKQPRANLCDLL